MSDKLHTLKEINLDAARYRWLRENHDTLYFWMHRQTEAPDFNKFDAYIDSELARDD